MPPILIAAAGSSGRHSQGQYVNQQTKDAETRLKVIERWRANPRHERMRWAHMVPQEELQDDRQLGNYLKQYDTNGDGKLGGAELAVMNADKRRRSSLRDTTSRGNRDVCVQPAKPDSDQTPLIASSKLSPEGPPASLGRQTGQSLQTGQRSSVSVETNQAYDVTMETNQVWEEAGSPTSVIHSKNLTLKNELKDDGGPPVWSADGKKVPVDGLGYWCTEEGRDEITLFFDEPTSSIWAKRASIGILCAIMMSVIAILLETLPELEHHSCCKDDAKMIFLVVEVLCTGVFTLEYGMRIFAARSKLEFFLGPMNLIDLLAILPFYVELMFSDASDLDILKLFRLVRIFRIFKLSKQNRDIETCLQVLYQCRALFILLVFVLLKISIVFGSFAYTFEKDIEGTAFGTIPDGMWWAIVSVNMVGYGDISPTTVGGKMTGCVCIVFGIGVLALPISVIGNTFSEAWQKSKAKERQAKAPLKELRGPQIEWSLKAVLWELRRFNQLCSDHITYTHVCYTEMPKSVGLVWKTFSHSIRAIGGNCRQKSERAQQAVRLRFVQSLDKFSIYSSSVEEWREYANDHPKYGRYRECYHALRQLRQAQQLLKKSEHILTKCKEFRNLSEVKNQVRRDPDAIDPEDKPDKEAPVDKASNDGALQHEMEDAAPVVDVELMQRYFNRYDLDDSGTINNSEELTQLCTNLIVKLSLNMRLDQLEALTGHVENIETHPWNFDLFRVWFEQKLRECKSSDTATVV